jgi:hypothetical protein
LTTPTPKTTKALVLLVGLTTGCNLGEVGGAESVCDQAVEHLAACGITSLPDTGSCNPTKQRFASQILQLGCADMNQRTSFSGASCNSFWSLFNPSCWGSDEPEGSSGGYAGDPGEQNGGKCYCDDLCVEWNDCCPSCGGSGGGVPSNAGGLYDACNPGGCQPGLECAWWQCFRSTGTKCNGSNECRSNMCAHDPTPGWYGVCTDTYTDHPWGGGGGGCFVAGTLIATPSGERVIESIRVGDEVLSYAPDLGRLTVGRVSRTFVHRDRPSGRVALDDGTVLRATPNHPFFRANDLLEISGQRPTLSVVSADQLSQDDTVMVLSAGMLRRARVKGWGFEGAPATVYNFTVDTYHTYFAEGVLVHNK